MQPQYIVLVNQFVVLIMILMILFEIRRLGLTISKAETTTYRAYINTSHTVKLTLVLTIAQIISQFI